MGCRTCQTHAGRVVLGQVPPRHEGFVQEWFPQGAVRCVLCRLHCTCAERLVTRHSGKHIVQFLE